MNPGNVDAPVEELDRRIFHILSNGQKQQDEICYLLLTSRFGEGSIRNNIKELTESYFWADEVTEQGTTYYYRKDVGRQPKIQKQPVDYSEIEELLLGLEIKLGIKSPNNIDVTSTSSTLPDYLNKLLELSNHNGKILTNEDHLERFFEVFDQIMMETENAYSEGGPPPNYPKKVHGLFYTVIAQRHECWKSKNKEAHEEFDRSLQTRLTTLKTLLNVVPPEIGNQIMRILAIVDLEEAREGFEIIVRSNEYDTDQLTEHAEACYAISNDIDELQEALSLISLDCEDPDLKKKINTIKKSARY